MTIIDDVGIGVTLRQVSGTPDEYGDVSETTSDSTINAVVGIMGAEEDIVKSGVLAPGDAVAFFGPSETVIKEGNRVKHNSIWYQIIGVTQHDIGGTVQHIEADMKRVVAD